jgi:hypothetical protein
MPGDRRVRSRAFHVKRRHLGVWISETADGDPDERRRAGRVGRRTIMWTRAAVLVRGDWFAGAAGERCCSERFT